MGDNSQSTIQWGVGIVCAMILAYMLYISGGPGRSYDIVAIIGMLTLIAILLGYQELVVSVLGAWRGNSNASGASSDERNDKERSRITQEILEDIHQEQRQRARNQKQNQTQSNTKRGTGTDTNTETGDAKHEYDNETEP